MKLLVTTPLDAQFIPVSPPDGAAGRWTGRQPGPHREIPTTERSASPAVCLKSRAQTGTLAQCDLGPGRTGSHPSAAALHLCGRLRPMRSISSPTGIKGTHRCGFKPVAVAVATAATLRSCQPDRERCRARAGADQFATLVRVAHGDRVDRDLADHGRRRRRAERLSHGRVAGRSRRHRRRVGRGPCASTRDRTCT